jgi:hypothetical protein
MEKQTSFRIGGCYRFARGVVMLSPHPFDGFASASLFLGEQLHGRWSLETGLWSSSLGDRAPSCEWLDLLPGEVHHVNGEWVPVDDQCDVTQADLDAHLSKSLGGVVSGKLHPADAKMIERDGPAKPAEVLFNGLTVEETEATASVMGIVAAKPTPIGLTLSPDLMGEDLARHQLAIHKA